MKLLYTGSFRFPDQDAAAKRVLNIAKSFPDHVSVDFAGWEDGLCQKRNYIHNGFNCFSQAEFLPKKNIVFRFFSFIFRGLSTFFWILKREKYDGIILYNPPFLFSIVMLIYGKVSNVKIILDNTEWYESEHLVGGRYGAASIENFLRMKVAYPRFRNIIAISKFLTSYYKSHGIKNVVTIPPISEHFEKTEKCESKFLRFVYIGNLGYKDKLDVLCNFIVENRIILNKAVILDIAGVEECDFFKIYPELRNKKRYIKEFVNFHGKIPYNQVCMLYRKADFSVFFRENKRYALAGFPTKFIESISYSVPVITNPIGDVVNYSDGVAISLDTTEIEEKIVIEIERFLKDVQPNKFEDMFHAHFSIESAKPKLDFFLKEAFK